MAKKIAFITGVTGQDGSYLAELLLGMGYVVHGLVRRSSSPNRERIDDLYLCSQNTSNRSFHLHYGDLADSSNLNRLLRTIKPDEIYNLGAQSHVGVSFNIPEYTADVDALGVLRLVDAIREIGLDVRLYQASTSELFGNTINGIALSEDSQFAPASPYASAKLYAYWITKNYRAAYGVYAVNGILFNHESPRRGESFVTRKITLTAARIKYGIESTLRLGNLDAIRDWGYAPEYVYGMWRVLQQDQPEDYVLATGSGHTVRAFTDKVFKTIDMELEWEGEGRNEKGIEKKTGIVRVEVDPEFFRPNEVDCLIGDATKAKKDIDWQATTNLTDLINIMMTADLNKISNFETK